MIEEKIVIMKELIQLYEQVQFVSPACSKMLIWHYIEKKEKKLLEILGGDKS